MYWNVLSEDLDEIEAALNSEELFTDSIIETEESSLSQINDCLKRMRTGDVSKFNHLPAFLREYYGRKSLIEIFGSDEEFPPLDDDLRARLSEITNDPAFRYIINTLIERKAVDRNGNSLTERLEEYDSFLNQKMMEETLNPPDEPKISNLNKKFGDSADKLISENAEKQVFIAKTLFMQQLGRMDIINEDGTVEPYSGTAAQLFARGNRVAFTLPTGNETEQDMIFDAWQKKALDSGVAWEGRFASHEMHRRQVDGSGNTTRDLPYDGAWSRQGDSSPHRSERQESKE